MNGCIYRTADDKCEFWSDHGKGIVSYCDFDGCEEKKPSNADLIRSMTDEELAADICRLELLLAKHGHRGFHAWLDWLKEEASE